MTNSRRTGGVESSCGSLCRRIHGLGVVVCEERYESHEDDENRDGYASVRFPRLRPWAFRPLADRVFGCGGSHVREPRLQVNCS